MSLILENENKIGIIWGKSAGPKTKNHFERSREIQRVRLPALSSEMAGSVSQPMETRNLSRFRTRSSPVRCTAHQLSFPRVRPGARAGLRDDKFEMEPVYGHPRVQLILGTLAKATYRFWIRSPLAAGNPEGRWRAIIFEGEGG